MISFVASLAFVAFVSSNVYGQQQLSIEPINPCAFTLCPVGTICVPNEPVQCFTIPCPRPQARCIPARGNKPGFCPRVHSESVGICVNLCNNDFDCPRRRKCCSNGCGRTCTRPLNRKPGVCPRRLFNRRRFGGNLCSQRCFSDYECPGNRKCCPSVFCGPTCRGPVFRRRRFYNK